MTEFLASMPAAYARAFDAAAVAELDFLELYEPTPRAKGAGPLDLDASWQAWQARP